jgi:hypothetical protein
MPGRDVTGKGNIYNPPGKLDGQSRRGGAAGKMCKGG